MAKQDSDPDPHVPPPYRLSGADERALRHQGLWWDTPPAQWSFSGRKMMVCFCDLKNSTAAMNSLGPDKFQKLQERVFAAWGTAILGDNCRGRNNEAPFRVCIDKFMGDCVMFYIDYTDEYRDDQQDRGSLCRAMEAVKCMEQIMIAMVSTIAKESEKHQDAPGPRLGLRFGVAMGDDIILSVLGPDPRFGDFTVTGSVVNLAARLEHASAAEFLGQIHARQVAKQAYTSILGNPQSVGGSELGHELDMFDQQIVAVHDLCQKRFEIRANKEFKEAADKIFACRGLNWRAVPFSPKGFSGTTDAYLLGGDVWGELFSRF